MVHNAAVHRSAGHSVNPLGESTQWMRSAAVCAGVTRAKVHKLKQLNGTFSFLKFKTKSYS